jgi:hypothetical protein
MDTNISIDLKKMKQLNVTTCAGVVSGVRLQSDVSTDLSKRDT